jgi:hydrogenase 3 maturation protease
MLHLENDILPLLKGRVIIMGVGNPLRSDDGVGPALVQELRKSLPKEKTGVTLIDAGEVPENYLTPVINLKPDTILIIDAADFQSHPGDARIVDSTEVKNMGLSTHNASLAMIMDLLKEETGASIHLLGIQPMRTHLGVGFSDEIKKTVEEISNIIIKGLDHA